jgi:hypothetical protein
MKLLKRLANLFSPTPSPVPEYWIFARCNRCGEVLKTRVNLNNDLSVEYEDKVASYFCRKILTGESRCFQRIEVELTFDPNRNLMNREIRGGQFISREEYETARAAG